MAEAAARVGAPVRSSTFKVLDARLAARRAHLAAARGPSRNLANSSARLASSQGQRFFVQLDPRLDDATEQAEDIIGGRRPPGPPLALALLVSSLHPCLRYPTAVAHGGQLTREIAAADFCLLQHRKQPEHEEALHLMRRTVNLVWVLASVARGCPAPYAEPGDVGGQRYRPFPLSALVTPTAFHGTASSYNGDAKRIIYLLFQCLGAEVRARRRLLHSSNLAAAPLRLSCSGTLADPLCSHASRHQGCPLAAGPPMLAPACSHRPACC